MGVGSVHSYGNQFMAVKSDASRTLFVPTGSNIYYAVDNDVNLNHIKVISHDTLQIFYNNGQFQLGTYTGNNIWYSDPSFSAGDPPLWGPPMDMTGVTITSPFGERVNPVPPPEYEFHNGDDLSAGGILGRTVVSCTNGTVLTTEFVEDVGNYIEITNYDGTVCGYAHLEDAANTYVSVGDTVEMGTQIGRVGSSGDSTGPHLELRCATSYPTWVDPVPFMSARGVSIP